MTATPSFPADRVYVDLYDRSNQTITHIEFHGPLAEHAAERCAEVLGTTIAAVQITRPRGVGVGFVPAGWEDIYEKHLDYRVFQHLNPRGLVIEADTALVDTYHARLDDYTQATGAQPLVSEKEKEEKYLREIKELTDL